MRMILLVPLFAAVPMPALAEPMTFDAAIDRATHDAPSLRASAASVDSARSEAVAAGQLPDPTLSIGIDNFPISGPPAFSFSRESMTMTRIGVEQAFPNPTMRRAQRVRAQANIGVARAGLSVETQTVRLETALAWIDLFYAKRRLTQLVLLDQSLKDLQATVSARLASGSARPSQALEPEQLLAVVADRRSTLEAEVAKAQAMLARLTGDRDADVGGEQPEIAIDPGALRDRLARNPRLLALDADIGTANAESDLARATKQPGWRVNTTYGRRNPAYGDMVSVGVGIDLPLFARHRQDPVIAARAADVERARFKRVEGERDLEATLTTDLADYEMRRRQLSNARNTLVPLTKRRAELDMASYAAGKVDLGSTLLSSLALAEAEVDALSREADVMRAAVRINYSYEEVQP